MDRESGEFVVVFRHGLVKRVQSESWQESPRPAVVREHVITLRIEESLPSGSRYCWVNGDIDPPTQFSWVMRGLIFSADLFEKAIAHGR